MLLLRFIDLSTFSIRGVCDFGVARALQSVIFQCFVVVAQYFEEILLGNQKSTLTELM